jgi:hypothetical protein
MDSYELNYIEWSSWESLERNLNFYLAKDDAYWQGLAEQRNTTLEEVKKRTLCPYTSHKERWIECFLTSIQSRLDTETFLAEYEYDSSAKQFKKKGD